VTGGGSSRRAGGPRLFALRYLLVSPALDFGSEPELYSTLSEVEHRHRHVVIPLLILQDGISVGEAQDLSDALRIEEIVSLDSDHQASLHR
jgi:hypothetical protein